MKSLEKLIEYLQKIADLNYISNILHWEMDTQAPSKSIDYLISVDTDIQMQSFNLATSDEYLKLLNDVIEDKEFDKLSVEEQIYLNDLKEDYVRSSRIPEDFYEEYSKTCSESNVAWEKAKKENDYKIFEPFLKKIITLTKELYRYMYPDSKNLYDDMLNTYEKGLTSDIIDRLFNELKEGILPIVKGLRNNKLSKEDRDYSNDTLFSVSYKLLDYIGFENDRGKLGIYPHGYTNKLNDNDVRITFSKNKDIYDHVCTVIHEGGHGIFEQSVGDNLIKYPGYNIDKYALHESQSRFFENILGRNKNFWIPIYDDIKNELGIHDSLDEFMEHLNDAKVSLVRTSADELTYCLHIIMRYEIERDIFSDRVNLDELEKVWNNKVKEYFGLEVDSVSNGILQDVHWSQGSFGYFPSYLLGSIFDGMLIDTINNEVGDIDELLSNGEIKKITNFLKENIYKYGGSFNLNEVANRVCGRDLEVKSLVEYFKNKYDR